MKWFLHATIQLHIGKVRQHVHKQGGGVCETIISIQRKKDIYEMAKNVDDIKESKFVDLSLKRKNIVIGITHRPPSDKFDT